MNRILIALLMLTAPVHAGVKGDFQRIWSERATQYASERATLERAADSTANSFIASYRSNGPNLISDFGAVLGAASDLSELAARQRTLTDLTELMKTKPSAAALSAWIQGKQDAITGRSEAAVREDNRLRALKIGAEINAGDWVAAKERLAQAIGSLKGETKELSLINENLQSYFAGLGQEQEAARRRAALLASMGAALANASRPPQTFSMTCNKFGEFTNCNGISH